MRLLLFSKALKHTKFAPLKRALFFALPPGSPDLLPTPSNVSGPSQEKYPDEPQATDEALPYDEPQETDEALPSPVRLHVF